MATMIETAQCLGRIFHNRNMIFSANVHHLIDSAGVTEVCMGHTGAYPSAGCLVVTTAIRLQVSILFQKIRQWFRIKFQQSAKYFFRCRTGGREAEPGLHPGKGL
ncbi:MAG: hypothetical protein V1844_21040 [Pseudomonadota bacterium]